MFILSMWSLSRKLYYLFTYIKKIIVDWLYKTPGGGTHPAPHNFSQGGGVIDCHPLPLKPPLVLW